MRPCFPRPEARARRTRDGGNCTAEGRAWHSASTWQRRMRGFGFNHDLKASSASRDPRLKFRGQSNPSPAGVILPGLGSPKPRSHDGPRRHSHAQAPDKGPGWPHADPCCPGPSLLILTRFLNTPPPRPANLPCQLNAP